MLLRDSQQIEVTMRLAAKHRHGLLGCEIVSSEGVRTIAGRFGVTETLRLGRGRPLVMLPGLAGGIQLLMPLARLLSRRHEVILLGFRGDSSSGLVACGRQAPGDHAVEVADLIVQMGLERPSVMGVSFGGAVALELALRYPSRVGGLILTGADAKFEPSVGSNLLLHALERFPLPRTSPFLNQFFNVLHGGRPGPGPEADFVIRRCWETDQSVVAARLRSLENFDLTDSLWNLDCPTMVIGGSRDVVVSPSRQKSLAAAISSARFERIESAGHVGFVTHRQSYAHSILSFTEGRVPVTS